MNEERTRRETLSVSTSAPHRIHRDFRLPVRLCRFNGRRYLCWGLLALGMIVGRVALLPILPPPQPEIHDEFSHLLAADTFAHGRLANPTPAHPEFFESPHILVHPVYASKFPPGQDLLLALGQKIAGHPYWGVVLSGALMVFVFCWMADAWLPPQWALIAGALSSVLFFVRHYWFESYWGGSLAAAGGALVVGGLGHVLRGHPSRARTSFALGILLLYSTRVYEGAVLCLAIAVVLGIHFWRLSGDRRFGALRALLPNIAILIAAAPLACWYNLRVSGHATDLPYVLYMRQYDLSPPLWTLPAYPPKEFSSANYNTERHWELDMYNYARGTRPVFTITLHLAFLLIGAVWMQFLAFGLLLLAIPWARMQGYKKWLVFLMAAGVAGLLQEVLNFPHYTAPFTGVLLLLIVSSGRALWYRIGSLRLRGPVFGLAMAVLAIPLVRDYATAFQRPRATPRSRTIRQLESMGGRHLVFVDYPKAWPGWDPNTEWVYNGADLDGSPVVFAHLRMDEENRELLEEYKDRTAWLVRLGPKITDVRIEPYSAHPQAGAAPSTQVNASSPPRRADSVSSP